MPRPGDPTPRFRLADVGRLLAGWAASTVALMITAAILPGLSATTPWAYVGVAAVAGPVGLVVRAVLVELSARIGWIALLVVALVGQAAVMYLAMITVPGISVGFGTAVLASWITAGIGTIIAWVTTVGTDDGLVTSLMHRGRKPSAVDDPEVDGVLFVQIDGVPFPVLRWAIQSGSVPTIRRWISSGTYSLNEWTAQLPCTTPASQLGILHGTVDRIPAFRWYDRELGRVLVANRPADARVIEERASTGRGLLYDGGISISNLFTGDAPRSLTTISRVELHRGSVQTRRAVAWFLLTPNGFARSLSRTLAEIAKERWQARRQAVRGLEPRVHRGWVFAGLRAATNGLLRDLNTALVAEEMRLGTRAIYVDYVDYDEIAHHAGMFRPESLAALDGLDRVLGWLERLSTTAARRYHIVALSDHGQSQGNSFSDRFGDDLSDVCETLMAQEVESFEKPVESWGRVDSVAAEMAGGSGMAGRVTTGIDNRLKDAYIDDPEDHHEEPVIVLGSGNLGLIYIRGERRWSLEELQARWPALLPGLVEHPGIGFVAGLDEAGSPWVIGAEGRRHLTTGEVEGMDPLLDFGDHAARVLVRAVTMSEAPDLYVNSTVDPLTLDVAAFEDLVGAHGGLGGWQDSAVFLAPREIAPDLTAHIEGADALHEILVAMLRACGHRTDESARGRTTTGS